MITVNWVPRALADIVLDLDAHERLRRSPDLEVDLLAVGLEELGAHGTALLALRVCTQQIVGSR